MACAGRGKASFPEAGPPQMHLVRYPPGDVGGLPPGAVVQNVLLGMRVDVLQLGPRLLGTTRFGTMAPHWKGPQMLLDEDDQLVSQNFSLIDIVTIVNMYIYNFCC